MYVKGIAYFSFFFFKHAYTSLHQSFSLSLSWRAYPAPQHLLTSSGAVLPWAFTALSSTRCQHLQHKLVHSEYSLCPVPCHHSHRKVWQGTSTSAFEFGAAVRFWSQPLKCPTYCALLCIMEQSPSAQATFLSDKTKLEEVPRQHRQSTPAARSMQSRGPHQSCSSSGPLLVATILACGEIALENQTCILLQRNLTNPFYSLCTTTQNSHCSPSILPKKQLAACLFRYLPNQHLHTSSRP